MASKNKRREAKLKHQTQKRRARYMKVFNSYRRNSLDMYRDFDRLLVDLFQLNNKYLQQMLNDLKAGYIPPWSGDYHRALVHLTELKILERTVLK